MTPHLIVSDLDGTLLDANHDLHPHTIETLRVLADRGHHLAFASGRHFRDMLAFRERLGVPIHVISTNGAYLHGPDDRLLSARHLEAELALELIAMERHDSVRLNLYREEEWLIDAAEPRLLAYHAHTGFGYRIFEPDELDGEGVGKVLYIGKPERLAGLEALVRERHGERLHVTYSTVNSLEIMAGGVNKGTALQALLESLGVESRHCLAFGDNLNDTEMLALAGEAHVMANAHPELAGRVPHARSIGHHAEVGVAALLRERFGI
ncbi:Cof-type HAD-IIB family hydrolase [Halomonas chromatireducens]|uniref:Pyridoxal phosphate phosphatase YigL n=1 Tax=Halomonas chromatireducens TaxID=507626 RepID=A0A0X8HFM7_9GAMM|nr:Cof-type HAD-IIB family hydrolase [Halomonas chromatireducens]AMD01768.1 Pyridoxal phosphate phosphatase YigL [Halomonas chromatireducens]